MTISRRLALSGASLALLGGCSIVSESITIRFRLTLYLDVFGTPRKQSTVLEGTWVDTKGYGQGERWVAKFRGDAIVFPIASDRIVIALLGPVQSKEHGLSLSNSMFYNFAGELRDGANSTDFWKRLKTWQGEHELPRTYWPVLLISPPNDPTEARYLDPDGTGSPVSVRKVTLKVTDEPVSRGIEKQIPWIETALRNPSGPLLPLSKRPPIKQLSPSNFRM